MCVMFPPLLAYVCEIYLVTSFVLHFRWWLNIRYDTRQCDRKLQNKDSKHKGKIQMINDINNKCTNVLVL